MLREVTKGQLMQKPTALGWDGALVQLRRSRSKYRQTRARSKRSQMLCNGAPAGQEIGLAQSERAASRPDLPTHWAQNEHAAPPPKEPLFPL